MIELIAMLTMLIDHLAAYHIISIDWFRIIGRIAMPLYAFGIAVGYSRTSNKKKYLLRLLFFAAISQIPLIYLQVHSFYLNIIFTFSISLLLLISLDSKLPLIYKVILVPMLLIFVEVLPFEYGSYAVLLVLIYRYSKKWTMVLLHLLLNYLFFSLDLISQAGLFSILGTAVIALAKYYPAIHVNRTFYRWFYPLHLTVIALYIYTLTLIN